MSFTKAANALNKALAQTDAQKAQKYAKTFFDNVHALASIRFGGVPRGEESIYKVLTMTADEIKKIHELAGLTVKVEEKPVIKSPVSGQNTRAVCYDAFAKVNMENATERRTAIDTLVQDHGFKKTVVQSYASNFRKK